MTRNAEMSPAGPSLWWLALLGTVLGANTLFYGWTAIDSASFSYIGRTILEGGVLYRDVWDIKAPAVYFLYALAHFVFGKEAIAFRIADVLWQIATAWVLARIAVQMHGKRWAGIIAGACYLVGYFSENFWNMAQPDGFLSLPLALSVLLLLRAAEQDQNLLYGLAAFWVGVAVLFKSPFGLFGIVLLTVAWVSPPAPRQRVFARLASLAAGVSAPVLAVGLYFFLRGALPDFLYSQFIAPYHHVSRQHESSMLPCFLLSARVMVRFPAYFFALLGVGNVLLSSIRGEPVPQAKKILLAWGVLGVVVLFAHGAFTGYHYLPLLAPAALLAADVLEAVIFGREPFRVALLTVIVLFLVIPVRLLSHHVVFTETVLRHPPPPGPMRILGVRIAQQTSPSDRIFVWGSQPLIYIWADRKSSSRFINAYPLAAYADGGRSRGIFLQEFRATPPKFFVQMNNEPSKDDCSGGLADFEDSYRQFSELRHAIESEYRLVEETPNYKLFSRNPEATPGAQNR